MKNSEILKGIIGNRLYNAIAYNPLKEMAKNILENKIIIEEQQNSNIHYVLHIGNEIIRGLRTPQQFKNDTLSIAMDALYEVCAELTTLQELTDDSAEYFFDLLNFIMTWDKDNE